MGIIKRLLDVATRWPNRPAIYRGSEAMTFGALIREVQIVSAWLRRKGVVPNAPIAIVASREPEVIVIALAALFSGCPFLFVEPTTPRLRTRHMLEDSRACLLVSPNATLAETSEGLGGALTTATYNPAWLRDIEPLPEEEGRRLDLPGSTAYVVFTSGSTGQPKGIPVRRESLTALIDALHAEVYPRGAAAGLNVAMLASFEFDPCFQQIFGALLGGHCLHIIPSSARADGCALLEFLDKAEIDLCDATPTHLRLIGLASRRIHPAPRYRRFLVGGELLDANTLDVFTAVFEPERTEIFNLYGVAECCVDTTVERVNLAEARALGAAPIGHPLPEMEASVVDDELRPVPSGTMGEILIGGVGVAEGYLARPELTDKSFVRLNGRDGRYYRTGDMGYQLPDGRLMHAGRRDRQIKVSGRRLELDEIETVARTVLCRPGAGGREAWSTCCRCLLDERVPGIAVTDGVCTRCRDYDRHGQKIARYFRGPDDFRDLVARAASWSRPDAPQVLLLYSGGKDSTYVLLKLIEAGLRVATFTFDNGYISDQALKNIERITARLEVDHTTRREARMDEIFRISLDQTSTVCTGCFRGISHYGTQHAIQKGISVVVTGLSRGQIYQTKLEPFMRMGIVDPDEIERRLVTQRHIYERRRDITAEIFGVAPSEDDLAAIEFVDYFRYDDANQQQVWSALNAVPDLWKRPEDTGFCSTNCRINDVGIWVHNQERGYHNYAEPLSWDVRLGISSRTAAEAELHQPPDIDQVTSILGGLGLHDKIRTLGTIGDVAVYATNHPLLGKRIILAGEHRATPADSVEWIRRSLAAHLPGYMAPHHILLVSSIPRLPSGKIDYRRLIDDTDLGGRISEAWSEDSTSKEEELAPLEQVLAETWREVLDLADVGRDLDFFEAGGDSLAAAIATSLVSERFGIEIDPADLFEVPTLTGQAAYLERHTRSTMTDPFADGTPASGDGVSLAFVQPLLGSQAFYEPILASLPENAKRHRVMMPLERAHQQILSARREAKETLFVGWSNAGFWAGHLAAAHGGAARMLALDPPPFDPAVWRREMMALASALTCSDHKTMSDAWAALEAHAVENPSALIAAFASRQVPWRYAFSLINDRARSSQKASLRELLGAIHRVVDLPEVGSAPCRGTAIFSTQRHADLVAETLPKGWEVEIAIDVSLDHWQIIESPKAADAIRRGVELVYC